MVVTWGVLGVDIGVRLCARSLLSLKLTAGSFLRFRSVRLRKLQTWPYVNLAGPGLEEDPCTLEAAYTWSGMRERCESREAEVIIVGPLY